MSVSSSELLSLCILSRHTVATTDTADSAVGPGRSSLICLVWLRHYVRRRGARTGSHQLVTTTAFASSHAQPRAAHITLRLAFPVILLLQPYSSRRTAVRLSWSPVSSATTGPGWSSWPLHAGEQPLGRILISPISWGLAVPLISPLLSLFSSCSGTLNSQRWPLDPDHCKHPLPPPAAPDLVSIVTCK